MLIMFKRMPRNGECTCTWMDLQKSKPKRTTLGAVRFMTMVLTQLSQSQIDMTGHGRLHLLGRSKQSTVLATSPRCCVLVHAAYLISAVIMPKHCQVKIQRKISLN
jgi:hypothetical protein